MSHDPVCNPPALAVGEVQRFHIEPTRGIAAPSDNYVKRRDKVRNKAMKTRKDKAAIEAEDKRFDGNLLIEFAAEEGT